jgi:hypothetical protein
MTTIGPTLARLRTNSVDGFDGRKLDVLDA